MIVPVKIAAVWALLVTVQNAGRSPPVAEKLDEAAKVMNAQVGARVNVELSGCMKDDRLSSAVTCYYTLVKTVPLEVHADQPNGPVRRVQIELPGGKNNVDMIKLVAPYMADLLIPTLTQTAREGFIKKLSDDFAGGQGGGSANVGPYYFEYRASTGKTTLYILAQ